MNLSLWLVENNTIRYNNIIDEYLRLHSDIVIFYLIYTWCQILRDKFHKYFRCCDVKI